MLCPKCDGMMVRRSEASGLLDRVYGAFSLVPFRCLSCQHRFHARQADAGEAERSGERRKTDRRPVQIPVNFECGDVVGEGTLTDLSKDGCTLDSKRRLRPGLLLRVHLPAGTDQVSPSTATQIATVRSVEGSRAGLKFLAFTPPEQMHLEETITRTMRKFSNS